MTMRLVPMTRLISCFSVQPNDKVVWLQTHSGRSLSKFCGRRNKEPQAPTLPSSVDQLYLTSHHWSHENSFNHLAGKKKSVLVNEWTGLLCLGKVDLASHCGPIESGPERQ